MSLLLFEYILQFLQIRALTTFYLEPVLSTLPLLLVISSLLLLLAIVFSPLITLFADIGAQSSQTLRWHKEHVCRQRVMPNE